jgi:hypothetical protein
VNLVVTDTPSAGITVLSFQIQITGAILQPGNVSILPKPVTVDLAQLVSDTGFLASTVIDSATYTSLQLTYANPQVTIQNNTGLAITAAGQTCAVGATCTFTPALNNASVTISSGVFPLTLTASSSTGLNLDLSIPDLLQSDLSISFANGSSVNLSLLGSGPAKIDDVLATVTSVSGTQVSVTTAFGNTLNLDETSSTAYSYPNSVCATPAASCVSAGQIVALDLALSGQGSLSIDSLTYVGTANASLVKGLVLSTATTGANPTAQVLLQRGVNAASLTAGEIATVSLAADATYAIATAAYPQLPSATFASAQDLLPGQELIVAVGSDLQHRHRVPAVLASHRLGRQHRHRQRVPHLGRLDRGVQQRAHAHSRNRCANRLEHHSGGVQFALGDHHRSAAGGQRTVAQFHQQRISDRGGDRCTRTDRAELKGRGCSMQLAPAIGRSPQNRHPSARR